MNITEMTPKKKYVETFRKETVSNGYIENSCQLSNYIAPARPTQLLVNVHYACLPTSHKKRARVTHFNSSFLTIAPLNLEILHVNRFPSI